ncbi:copper resistance protein B, partial [Stenotrophomonas sp. HITSZ_GD]|uniref:copper resistance protein B n=1 Tax=Stenotrophomonas sp. HITSZ_GD TaxID=3037248 RepID=UPI00240D7A33
MDHSQMDHSQMDHSQMDHSQMDHSQMDHSQRESTASPRTPIPAPTPADFAAAFPALRDAHMHGAQPVHYVLVDRLEGWNHDAGSGQAWEVNGWYGGDIHRLRLRSEGEREAGRTHAADAELLYGRAISPWWELVAGVRQDFAPGASRARVAIGVQGLAPYKFEVSATAYLGGGSGAGLRLEGEYTLWLTSRWILQPRLEANLSTGQDARRGEGGGLDSASVGLRLRYEASRRFAPYVGWEHERRFGDAARFARDDGDDARGSRFVAGVRFWF